MSAPEAKPKPKPEIAIQLRISGPAAAALSFLRGMKAKRNLAFAMPYVAVPDGRPPKPLNTPLSKIADGKADAARADIANVEKRLSDASITALKKLIDDLAEVTKQAREARGDDADRVELFYFVR